MHRDSVAEVVWNSLNSWCALANHFLFCENWRTIVLSLIPRIQSHIETTLNLQHSQSDSEEEISVEEVLNCRNIQTMKSW